jgi:predicted SAM-dependent methyltransferase
MMTPLYCRLSIKGEEPLIKIPQSKLPFLMLKAGQLCARRLVLLARPRFVRSYIASHEIKKLQVSAGYYPLDGWLNADLLPWSLDYLTGRSIILDARKKFSFDDCTFDYVFSEHTIEHITYSEGAQMLRECFRILVPGGKIRVATPNLENILSLHRQNNNEPQQAYIRNVIQRQYSGSIVPASVVINDFFHSWGHKFIYDRETVQSLVELAGFTDVAWFDPGVSDDPQLRGIESHGKAIGEEMNRFETIVLEATRPARTWGAERLHEGREHS